MAFRFRAQELRTKSILGMFLQFVGFVSRGTIRGARKDELIVNRELPGKATESE